MGSSYVSCKPFCLFNNSGVSTWIILSERPIGLRTFLLFCLPRLKASFGVVVVVVLVLVLVVIVVTILVVVGDGCNDSLVGCCPSS